MLTENLPNFSDWRICEKFDSITDLLFLNKSKSL